jgi:biotin carboxylase
MTKTLLVLAASTYQIPAIKTAKRLGYRVLTADNIPSNPGHLLADASFCIDTTDLDGMLNLAIREGISGVIASGTDVAVTTAASISEKLNLPGVNLVAAQVLTHKQRFREFLKDSGFPCPRTFSIINNVPPEDDCFDGRKWLVKPSQSSGSKGVFIVTTKEEFNSYIRESCSFSLDGTALFEEYIEGTQHTVEGILREGKIRLGLLTDRDTAIPPHTATMGHRVPSRLPKNVHEKLYKTVEQVLDLLGVANGPFDCDFVVNGDQVVLIEITPRLGGNSLSKLFEFALGFDLVAYAVSYACGDEYPLPVQCHPKPAAISILGVDYPGKLYWDESEANDLQHEVWVDTMIFDLPIGSMVQPFINGRYRLGETLITGSDRNDIDAKLIELKNRLALSAF